MDQTFDAILLLVSGAAGLYCFILSRRLKALQDMKTGIGASILAMTNAIAQLNAASHDSKQQTAMASNQLKSLLQEADQKITHMRALTQALEQKSKQTSREVHDVHNELSSAMHGLLLQSHQQIEELTGLMRQLRALQDKTNTPLQGLPPTQTIHDLRAKAS